VHKTNQEAETGKELKNKHTSGLYSEKGAELADIVPLIPLDSLRRNPIRNQEFQF